MIHIAVLKGYERVVQLLLEAEADLAELESQHDAGGKPGLLSLAVLVGQWGCAEALLCSPMGAEAVRVSATLSRTQFWA